MKAETAFKPGDIVSPLPKELHVVEDELRLSDGRIVHHSALGNVTILSRFLVATMELAVGDTIALNFNLAFYDMETRSKQHAPVELRFREEEACHFESPVVSGFRYLSEEEKQNCYVFADEWVRQAAIADGFVPRGMDGGIDVLRTKSGELMAFSSKDHEMSSLVFESAGVRLPFPVRSTIELPGDAHLRLTGGSEFIYHSCLPNMHLEVDGERIRGIALRPIEKGEKLTFNYLCSEWQVSKVFHCQCNKYCCYGLIKGFKYLEKEQQEHLLPQCTAAVREKYAAPLLQNTSLQAITECCGLAMASSGRIVAQSHVLAGTVLMCTEKVMPYVEGKALVVDQVRIPHSCNANTVLLEGRLVAAQPLLPGDALSFNLSLLHWKLPTSFDCDCGATSCQHHVQGFETLSEEDRNAMWSFASDEARSAALRNHHRVSSSSPFADVRMSGKMGLATYASQAIPRHTRVFHVTGLVIPFPTVYTIYLGEGKHLLFASGAHCLAHSCAPNTRIVVDPVNGSLDCFATEDIATDTVISFNYLTTEWEMDQPFTCACATPKCYGKIEGFKHLGRPQQLHLWATATTAVQAMFAQTQQGANSLLVTLNPDFVGLAEETGLLRLNADAPSGTVLLATTTSSVTVDASGFVQIGDLRIPHSCNPSCVFLEGHIVLCRAEPVGGRVTLNVNHLVYQLDTPFSCTCGEWTCVRHVAGFSTLSTEEKDALLLCSLPEVRAEAIRHGYHNKSCSPLVEVRDNGAMGQATFAAANIKAGTRFFTVSGLVLPFPTVYTIMLESGKHLLFAGGAQCLAHSCEPNVRVIVDAASRTIDCLALRDIQPGEVISFNYLCTEWDMNSPFKCVCQSAHCYGKIAGFKHLVPHECQVLWSMATPAIRSLAQQSPNWERLASSELRTDSQGHVTAAKHLREGLPLLTANQLTITNNTLTVDRICLRHSCHPTAAIIDHKVVLLKAVVKSTEITIDLSCLAYTLAQSFTCHCSAAEERGDEAGHLVSGFGGLDAAVQAERLIYTDAAVREEALRRGFRVPCSCPQVDVKANGNMGQATFAATPIAAGARFFHVKGLGIPFPTVYTIMLTPDRHLLFADGAQCLAHSCDPNVKICVDPVNNTLECEALRDIAAGDLIAFDYNTTEWDMSAPFRCLCQSPCCVMEVKGFKHLTQSQRRARELHITPAIRELAGESEDVHLPTTLKAEAEGQLVTAQAVVKESVVLELVYADVQPTRLGVGSQYSVAHSTEPNCVLVESRLIAKRKLDAEEKLTVDMNLFVYDMVALFPRTFSEDCKGFRYLSEEKKQRQLYLCEPPVRAHAMRDGWVVQSTQALLEVRPNGDMGQTAYATENIPSGTRLFHCTGLLVPFPTMYTICVGVHRHLLFGDAAECIAHHCDPNVAVQVNEEDGTFDFVTIRDIAKSDMVTFNYNTTEWDMNTPFVCLCGSTHCAGTIHGFKHLGNSDRQRLWPIVSDVVKRQC